MIVSCLNEKATPATLVSKASRYLRWLTNECIIQSCWWLQQRLWLRLKWQQRNDHINYTHNKYNSTNRKYNNDAFLQNKKKKKHPCVSLYFQRSLLQTSIALVAVFGPKQQQHAAWVQKNPHLDLNLCNLRFELNLAKLSQNQFSLSILSLVIL